MAEINERAMRLKTITPRNGAAYVPLLLRVTLGSLFIAHLYWKVAVYPGGLDRWWSNFACTQRR